jgi:hypothetical protein
MAEEKQRLEEKDGALRSRDRCLSVDPKTRKGRLTISGQRLDPEKSEAEEPARETEKEN